MDSDALCMGCLEVRGAAQYCPRCGWREGTPQQFPSALPARTVLAGKYLLGRVLGQGGFGITYLAWDPHLSRKLAIKEFFPSRFAARGGDGCSVWPVPQQARALFDLGCTRFLEEAQCLARLQDNPCIASALDIAQANGTAYLVMSYADGMTFEQYLAQHGGSVPFELALRVLGPVMDSLREVHATGFLHRDVCPENIFLTYGNQVRLIGFGGARQAIGEYSGTLPETLRAGYAPEEQYRSSAEQGPWTDLYALAATFYRAITGTTPAPGAQRPGLLGVSIPPESEDALMQALSLQAADRFQSIAAFQRAITPGPRPAPAPVEQPAQAPRRPARFRKFAAAVLAIVLALLAWGAYRIVGRTLKSVAASRRTNSSEPAQPVAMPDVNPPSEPSPQASIPAPVPQSVPEPPPPPESIPAPVPQPVPEPAPTAGAFRLSFIGFRNEDEHGNRIMPETEAEAEDQKHQIYRGDKLLYLGYRLVLDNLSYDIRDTQGVLRVVFYRPDGSIDRNEQTSPPDGTLRREAVISRSERQFTDRGRWGSRQPNTFETGVWRIEFYWNAEKVAQGSFRVAGNASQFRL